MDLRLFKGLAVAAISVVAVTGCQSSSGSPVGTGGKPLIADEILFPAFGLNAVPSGGKIPFDNRGGPKGGMEVATWSGVAPHGIYGLGVQFVSGVPVVTGVESTGFVPPG